MSSESDAANPSASASQEHAAFPDIVYSREMGVTHRDFFRILPRAMGPHAYRVVDDTVHGSIDDGSVEIHVGEERIRRIALMAIPYAVVSFSFRNVSATSQQVFKKHFDLHFQRGGG